MTTLRRIPALDGLRGLAVLGVVAFHAGYLSGGFLGVDLFFTLSGYLITSLLLAEIETTSRVDLKRFWSRRARRLLPAVLVLVALVPLYGRLWANPFEQEGLRGDSLATLAYVANWRQILQGSDYWARFAAPSPLQHTWSLAIEEQFYVVFPFLVLLAIRLGIGARSAGLDLPPERRRRAVEDRLLVIAGGLGLLSALAMIVGGMKDDASFNTLYFSSFTRFASILVGVVLAAMVRRVRVPEGRAHVLLQGAAIALLALLAVAWWRVPGDSAFVYRGGLLACALAAAVVIFVIQLPHQSLLHRGLSLRPLVWVGLVSYGLYLWHWPVFLVLDEKRTGLDGLALLVVRLAVTMMLVVPSYYLLEDPIRRGRLLTSLQARRVLPVVVATVVVLVLLLGRTPPDPLEAVSAAQVPTGLVVGRPPGTRPRVLLVGDSVGDSLGSSLSAAPDRLGVDVRSLALPGCGFFTEVTRIRFASGKVSPDGAGCKELIASWPVVASTFRPDVALVVVGFPGGIDREVDGSWEPFCGDRVQRLLEQEASAALDQLHTEVATVALTTVSPSGAGHRHGAHVDDVDCVNATYRRVAASRPWVHIVDLDAHVCPERYCRETVDGYVMRPDGLHYWGPSAAIVGRWVVEQGLQAASSSP